jgi:D-glycero-alpha-D-manno-heptose-7-phosphate kinase
MIIIKTPLRISLFGGSSDYESFYKMHGSFLIGTTIDKYSYLSARLRPSILSKEFVIVYSKMEQVTHLNQIHNPLIRETLKYRQIKDYIELFSFSDIPTRTGLGGSSAYCIGLLYLLDKLYEMTSSKKQLINDAIQIERHILNESGGIQDYIFPVYGGLNSIEINTKGEFFVKSLPVTEEFHNELEMSMVLIYTNEQRNQNTIAKSHENKDKLQILELSREAYKYFLTEDIKNIGKLLYESWKEKRNLSPLISTDKIDTIITQIINCGTYGVKVLGAGGCGFILCICNQNTKTKLKNIFKDNILNIKFESKGISRIY